jgi:D-beta-D-heptose 7-phosphate kinase/D-beta-D-heptose 1-phosphate adenosyltransferase
MVDIKKRLIKNLPQLLDKMSGSKVVVIGDLILDRFLYGTVDRISPEAPVPVVDVREERNLLGGAANVVRNIRALGGNTCPVGVVGFDVAADEIELMLKGSGIEPVGLVVDRLRPTAVKTRVIAQHQQVVRFDREEKKPLTPEVSRKVRESALSALSGASAIIVSDYGKGVVHAELMAEVVALAKRMSIPVCVDPKPVNISLYRGASVITPNSKETEAMSGMGTATDEEATAAGKALMEKLGTESILVTRGERGMTLVQRDAKPTHIPTMAKDVFDVTGAGDTAISVFTLAWAAGADIADAAYLANLASGIVVGKLGTAVVTPEELKEALLACV